MAKLLDEHSTDPSENLLNRAATQLAQLLKEASGQPRAPTDPDPQMDLRAEAIAILRENDLLSEVPAKSSNPLTFALVLVEENPLLYHAVNHLRCSFEPKACETVADLLTSLMPSDGHLD